MIIYDLYETVDETILLDEGNVLLIRFSWGTIIHRNDHCRSRWVERCTTVQHPLLVYKD